MDASHDGATAILTRWAMPSELEGFIRIEEQHVPGKRCLWLREKRGGSTFPISPEAARELGQQLLDFAAAVRSEES